MFCLRDARAGPRRPGAEVASPANTESQPASQKEATAKGDYLKKFQTLMYVNSKYFNLQKFFESKKQLKVDGSQENFDEEAARLDKRRRRKRLERLRREHKGPPSPFDGFRAFKKRRRAPPPKPTLRKRFSSVDRKRPDEAAHESNAQFLAQSCVPLESPAKRFSVLHLLLLKKAGETAKRPRTSAKKPGRAAPERRQPRPGASLFDKQGKSGFVTASKIKSSINTIRQKRGLTSAGQQVQAQPAVEPAAHRNDARKQVG